MLSHNKIGLLSMITVGVVVQALLMPEHARAAGDLTKQKPIELKVQLGDDSNALRFHPGHLSFETGNLHKVGLEYQFSEALLLVGRILTGRLHPQGPGEQSRREGYCQGERKRA